MFDAHREAWDFPVEMEPLFTGEGIEAPNTMAIVRKDTNQILGTHSKRYNLIPHDDIINKTMDAIADANISKDFKTKFEVFENGAKLRGEILFPDINIEPVVGDYSSFRIEFYSSYDAAWPYAHVTQAFRWWCANGCTTADTFASTRRKHTKNLVIEADTAKMKASVSDFMGLESKWKEWMGISVTETSAEYFFKKTLAKTFSHTSKFKHNETQLEKLMEQFHSEKAKLGRNKWALYNTMTAWATHTDALSSPAAARRTRQTQVASAMQDSYFTSM